MHRHYLRLSQLELKLKKYHALYTEVKYVYHLDET